MEGNEIATKSDILELKHLIQQLASNNDDTALVKKRVYSRKEACIILGISVKKFLKLEETGKVTGGDYLPSGTSGKLLYKASSIDKLIDKLPN